MAFIPMFVVAIAPDQPQGAGVPMDELMPNGPPVLTSPFIAAPTPTAQSSDPAAGYATSG